MKVNRRVPTITCLFLDIGGVLLTDGWDHNARKIAAMEFDLDYPEFESRHLMNFEMFEEGRLSLDDYLHRVVFFAKRSFTPSAFKRFMFVQSKPFPLMIELFAQIKRDRGLKVAVVSNESRELNAYRISKFDLGSLVDAFVSSSFVHIRKPDAEIFRLALDIVQTPPQNVLYVEDTPLFVEVAESLGIRSILHTDIATTVIQLASLGLTQCDETPAIRIDGMPRNPK